MSCGSRRLHPRGQLHDKVCIRQNTALQISSSEGNTLEILMFKRLILTTALLASIPALAENPLTSIKSLDGSCFEFVVKVQGVEQEEARQDEASKCTHKLAISLRGWTTRFHLLCPQDVDHLHRALG